MTKGEYRTALPDGRIQIVSYVADDEGYHATVTYEGEPTYPPEPKGGYKPSLSFDVFNNPDLLEPLSAEYEPLPPAPGYGAPVPPVSTPLPPPPPPRKPVYSTLPPPPPPKKPTYEKFRHSNKVTDPYKPPYTVNGRIVGAEDYDYYDYNDIYSPPTPKPTYEAYKPPPPKPTYDTYKPPPPKQYHPVNEYAAPPVVTTPHPLPIITTTPASYAPPPPTPTYANAYSPSPSYTAPPTPHPSHQTFLPDVAIRELNFRVSPSPTESFIRGARKVTGSPPTQHKKSKLPTYPNFKPVFSTASSLLDSDYDYDDYREESVTLPPRQNTATATTERPQVVSTTPKYYPTTPSIYTSSLSPTGGTPSARGLVNSQNGFASFSETTTPPYTTNKLYITTPKPAYNGPYSFDYVERNYGRHNDLDSSPSQVTASAVSKSTKVTTYRPNGFSSANFSQSSKNKRTHQNGSSKERSTKKDSGLNSSTSYGDQPELGLDYNYDYYEYLHESALDYLQGRITQLNSKINNKPINNKNNKRYKSAKNAPAHKWSDRNHKNKKKRTN